jgi:histidinol phosphatase-like enzyme
MSGPTIEAVFLDRDGVINEEVDLLYRPEQLKLIPGSSRAIKTLNDENVKVIIVTNQPVLLEICVQKCNFKISI